MACDSKVTVKDQGEKVYQVKNFKHMVCVARGEDGEDYMIATGSPSICLSMLTKVGTRIVEATLEDVED